MRVFGEIQVRQQEHETERPNTAAQKPSTNEWQDRECATKSAAAATELSQISVGEKEGMNIDELVDGGEKVFWKMKAFLEYLALRGNQGKSRAAKLKRIILKEKTGKKSRKKK